MNFFEATNYFTVYFAGSVDEEFNNKEDFKIARGNENLGHDTEDKRIGGLNDAGLSLVHD